jgi:hypothetical protein
MGELLSKRIVQGGQKGTQKTEPYELLQGIGWRIPTHSTCLAVVAGADWV